MAFCPRLYDPRLYDPRLYDPRLRFGLVFVPYNASGFSGLFHSATHRRLLFEGLAFDRR